MTRRCVPRRSGSRCPSWLLLPLEIEVRCERALEQVLSPLVDAPLGGVGYLLFEPELDRAVVELVGVLAEEHPCTLVAVALVVGGLVEEQLGLIRDQGLADVEASP